MGQHDVLNFIKNNEGEYFSADDISSICNINRRNAKRILERLRELNNVEVKEVRPPKGMPKKVYTYMEKDQYLELTFRNLNWLKDQEEYRNIPNDTLLLVLIAREMRVVSEQIEEWVTSSQQTQLPEKK